LIAAHGPVPEESNVSIAGDAVSMTTVAEAVIWPLRSAATDE